VDDLWPLTYDILKTFEVYGLLSYRKLLLRPSQDLNEPVEFIVCREFLALRRHQLALLIGITHYLHNERLTIEKGQV
jgi:hypothetical protein